VSAYTIAFQRLVAGGATPTEAADVLARLRQETGADLAADLREYAASTYAARPGQTKGRERISKRAYAAVMRAADRLALTAAAARPAVPTQRDTGSTA
jgi:hypothetical protein